MAQAGDTDGSLLFAVSYLVTSAAAQLSDGFLSRTCWDASSLGSAALDLSGLDHPLSATISPTAQLIRDSATL